MKLNIGSGMTKLDGFTPIDRQFGAEAFPLDYADDSAEEIRASHILEHFGSREIIPVLTEWVRVLQPGGRIRIAVPDIDRVMQLRTDGDPMWSGYLMGGQTDENDFHRSVFNGERLRSAMEAVGIRNIQEWESNNTDTACHPCSLRLEGNKPSTVSAANTLDVKIKALMSLPRHSANSARGCIEHTLQAFHIPCAQHGGAYWSHTLQNALEDFVRQDIDWALLFDHDTFCTPEDLDKLMGLFGRRPDIDALAALQCKRHCEFPLLSVKGETAIETDGSPIEVDTAHFGMTLIRIAALRKTPLPWFWEIPTIYGGWRDPRADKKADEKKTDGYDEHALPPDDIPVDSMLLKLWTDWDEDDSGQHHYDADIWFWKQWRQAGNRVFVAPSVRIGHLEEVVVDFDESMKARHQYPHKWRERRTNG